MCTSEMTCDICKDWSAAQWEHFIKKRTYKDRKKTSRPSGFVPPASLTSPRAETLSEVSQTGTFSSSFSCPSGGQGRREGSQGAPGVVSREASSPPAGSRSSERGGSVSGLSSVARERASSSAPSGAGEGVVARSQRTSLARSASSAVSPHSSPHVRRHGELRETSEDRSRVLSLRDSRSSDREPRKDKRARARSCSSRDRGRRSRSLSSSRSRSRGGEHRRRSSSRSLSSRVRSRRDRSRSSDCYRSRSSDRYGSHRDHWRDCCVLRTATDHVVSVHVPQLVGEVGVTGRGHTIPPVALVTARGHGGDNLPPLTARGLRKKDNEPDEISGRVVRR